MNKLKIIKKSPMTKNLVFFCLLSPMYLFLLESLYKEATAFNVKSLITFSNLNIPLLTLMGLTVISIWKLSKYSHYLLILFCSSISLLAFKLFTANFDKLILVLSSIYLLLAFYMIILWLLEKEEVLYIPNYHRADVDHNSMFDLEVTLLHKGKEYHGHLTNWGKDACFIRLDEVHVPQKGFVEITVLKGSRSFKQIGEIATIYERGLGLRFLNTQEDISTGFDWPELYEVLYQRGYSSYFERRLKV